MTQETLIAEAAPATEAAPASTQDGATATAAAADGQTQQAADGAQAGATAAPADASQSAANPKAEPKTDDADLGLWCGPTGVNVKRGEESVGHYPYDSVLGEVRVQDLDR